MKIEGPNRTQSAGAAKGKSRVSDADSSFGDLVARESGGAREASPTHQIARVDALLSVQAAEDPAARASRGRMVKRSGAVLDELDRIRMAMLAGTLTVGHMVDIADVVASHREKIDDPELVAVLDEIDLRAQVELAKLRVSLERQAV